MGKGIARESSDDETHNSAAQVIDESMQSGPAGCAGSRGENGRKQKEAGEGRSGEGRSQSQQRFLAGDAPPTPEPEDDFAGATENVLAFAVLNDDF
jgi:hypothetical protein